MNQPHRLARDIRFEGFADAIHRARRALAILTENLGRNPTPEQMDAMLKRLLQGEARDDTQGNDNR